VGSMAPEILLFKNGYSSEVVGNYTDTENPKHMQSDWDGKIIKLKPFHGAPEKYAADLSELSDALKSYTASATPACHPGHRCAAACQWEHIPKMVQSIGRQFLEFEKQGIHRGSIFGDLIVGDDFYKSVGCASPKAMLGENGR
jgi:hypothetical protein